MMVDKFDYDKVMLIAFSAGILLSLLILTGAVIFMFDKLSKSIRESIELKKDIRDFERHKSEIIEKIHRTVNDMDERSGSDG